MTTTYIPADLATSTLYQVRFNLGDTDSTSWELQDEEIDWAITERGNAWGATAMCALALAAKYSRLTSLSADGVSQALQQKAVQFRLVAQDYQKKEALYCARPYLFGVSKSDMLATIQDSDRVPDIFRLGLNDDPPTDGISPVNEPPTRAGGF
ncbi:MAG: hypothetical protein KGL39_03270 [Patescibacteria group bacterium]|nr:hypothetical protein [Patescibacteria group bacterium]